MSAIVAAKKPCLAGLIGIDGICHSSGASCSGVVISDELQCGPGVAPYFILYLSLGICCVDAQPCLLDGVTGICQSSATPCAGFQSTETGCEKGVIFCISHGHKLILRTYVASYLPDVL
jgi:hypothetical protein